MMIQFIVLCILYAGFCCLFFFFQAEDGIRDYKVTGVQTCALPIYNFVDANTDVLIRNSTATGSRDGYQLSNSGYNFRSKTNTARAKWTATLASRFANELLVGYQRIRDKRELPNRVPLIFVGGDRGGTSVAAGADRFSHANSLDQDIYEVTDNLTFARGSHLITLGTHNEFFHFVNVFFPASLGVWTFPDTAALRTANPSRYERALPLRPQGPNADRSEEHTSELQSPCNLVCRLLLEKKKKSN